MDTSYAVVSISLGSTNRPPRASHWPRTAVSRPPPLGRLDGGVGFGGFLFCIGGGCSMLWAAQSAPTGSICGDCLSAASHQNPLSRIQQPFSGPTIEFFRPSRPLRDRCNGEGCRLEDVCVPSGMYSASVHSHAASRSRGRGRIRPAKSSKNTPNPAPIATRSGCNRLAQASKTDNPGHCGAPHAASEHR